MGHVVYSPPAFGYLRQVLEVLTDESQHARSRPFGVRIPKGLLLSNKTPSGLPNPLGLVCVYMAIHSTSVACLTVTKINSYWHNYYRFFVIVIAISRFLTRNLEAKRRALAYSRSSWV